MEYKELEGVVDIDLLKGSGVVVDDITQYDHNNTIVIQFSNGFQVTLNAE